MHGQFVWYELMTSDPAGAIAFYPDVTGWKTERFADLADYTMWLTAQGPLRVFPLLHRARPVLLNLGEPGTLDITPWADRVQLVDASYDGAWELPVLGAVAAPTVVLIRPDGYVAWVGAQAQEGLVDALTTWFGAR